MKRFELSFHTLDLKCLVFLKLVEQLEQAIVMVKMLLLFIVLAAGVGLQAKGLVLSAPESYDFAISSESQLSLLKLKETQVKNLQNYNEVLKTHLKKIKL